MRSSRSFILLFFFIGVVPIPGQGQNTTKVEPAMDRLAEFPNVRDFTISSDGKEAYFTIVSPGGEISLIAGIRQQNGVWGEPEIASFSSGSKDLEPFLAPDGLRLYFASDRWGGHSTAEQKNFDIWFVERTSAEDPWSTPTNVGAPVNTVLNEFYPAVASNGNLYFTSDWESSKGRDDIFLVSGMARSTQHPSR